MRAPWPVVALLAALAFAPAGARAESWAPAEVAAAEKLRVEEAARAAAYRERVARGDVRAAAAPRPRSAPQTPGSAGEPLREAADIIDLLERWLGGEALEPRRTERRRSRDDADDWWAEEERRLREDR